MSVVFHKKKFEEDRFKRRFKIISDELKDVTIEFEKLSEDAEGREKTCVRLERIVKQIDAYNFDFERWKGGLNEESEFYFEEKESQTEAKN